MFSKAQESAQKRNTAWFGSAGQQDHAQASAVEHN